MDVDGISDKGLEEREGRENQSLLSAFHEREVLPCSPI